MGKGKIGVQKPDCNCLQQSPQQGCAGHVPSLV
jgi:hypothetical protein